MSVSLYRCTCKMVGGFTHFSARVSKSRRACVGSSGFLKILGEAGLATAGGGTSGSGSYSGSPFSEKPATYCPMPVYGTFGGLFFSSGSTPGRGRGAKSSSSFLGSPVLCPEMPSLSFRSASSLAASALFLQVQSLQSVSGARKTLCMRLRALPEPPHEDRRWRPATERMHASWPHAHGSRFDSIAALGVVEWPLFSRKPVPCSRVGQQSASSVYAYLRGSLPGCTHCYFIQYF